MKEKPQGDALRERAPFSPRLLGLGFWQAWWMLVLCTPLVLPRMDRVLGVSPGSWTLVLTSIGFGLIALFARAKGPLLGRRGSLVLAGLLCSGGTALCLAADVLLVPAAGSVAFALSLCVAAFGNALLLVMWGELWASLATERVIQYLFSSYAFAFVLFFAVQALPQPAAAVALCLLPAVSCVVLRSSEAETRRSPSSAPFVVDGRLAARAVFAVAAAGMAYGLAVSYFSRVSAPAEVRSDFVVAGLAFAALTLFALLGRSAVDPAAVYRPITPAISVGIMLLAVLSPAFMFLGDGLVIAGGYCLDMAVMLVSTDLAFRAKRPIALYFACSIIALRIATVFGLTIVNVLNDAGLMAADSPAPLVAAAVLVIVAGTLVFTQADLQRFYRIETAPWAGDDLAERCRALAEGYGLTARESEVFELLAGGRNVPFTCKELCIAESTARHHVGSIYRKLGVYDRQSMLDVIQQG